MSRDAHGSSSITVRVPRDENGFLGRECPDPECERYFKIKPGTGLQGKDLPCHCPYCGLTGLHNRFWTPEQLQYARSVAKRQLTDVLRKELKKLEFDYKPPRGAFGIRLSSKYKPGSPVPIHYYEERSLETHIRCDICTLEYALYGVFAFCPDCGSHNSLQILAKNLELVGKQLNLANALDDPALRQYLIEDALENCVSSFDGFGRECCRIRAAQSSDAERCRSVSFQNLYGASKHLKSLFGVDFERAVQRKEWRKAHVAFMRRHLISHRSGVIDEKYLVETGEDRELLGRRIQIESQNVTELVGLVLSLGRQLLELLPAP